MKLSCNGCRILRKGCSEDCVIRPCLEWLNSPQAQANATLFLAKFYGRAGLVNLINAAPEDRRTAVFKSLMYEACGRIVNPASGSLGLFWTGEWAQCQAAVDAVLTGSPISVMEPSHSQATGTRGREHVPPILDIRHVSNVADVAQSKGKGKLKRTGGNVIRPKPRVGSVNSASLWKPVSAHERGRSSAQEPGGSESESESEETVEAVLVGQVKPSYNGGAEPNLELSLG